MHFTTLKVQLNATIRTNTGCYSVADPEFPQGRGANPPGGGATYDFAKISQKLHENERIGPKGRSKFY